MDPTQVPQTPFVRSEKPLYGTWDHRISPYAYIEQVLKSTAQSIDDNRDYLSIKVLSHLKVYKAELVECSKNVSDGTVRQDDDGDLAAILGGGYDNGRSYYLYWYKGCLLELEGNDGTVNLGIYAPIGHAIEPIHAEFAPYLAPRKRAAVSVLLNSPHGMTTKSVDFEPPVIDDLEMSYGEGFGKVDEQIMKKLGEKRSSLMCFHGPPGVGKTAYLKHLTSRVDREFIFVPVGLAGELSSPGFLNLLLEHQEAILVLEDAEQALQSREIDHWNSSTIATLLNLSDGILGALLNITIIATYNADKQGIDKALLRKGRLAFDHTFEKLSAKDAKRLAIHLKKDPSFIHGPTSLADIYNAEDDTGYVEPEEKVMGFAATMVKG
jgi:hypothetical protein